jgi:hypothetical protein
MTRTREELADELERRVGFLRELRDGTGHEGKATLATQMAHAADVGWAVEQNLRTILDALREPPEPTAEQVERAAALRRKIECPHGCRSGWLTNEAGRYYACQSCQGTGINRDLWPDRAARSRP